MEFPAPGSGRQQRFGSLPADRPESDLHCTDSRSQRPVLQRAPPLLVARWWDAAVDVAAADTAPLSPDSCRREGTQIDAPRSPHEHPSRVQARRDCCQTSAELTTEATPTRHTQRNSLTCARSMHRPPNNTPLLSVMSSRDDPPPSPPSHSSRSQPYPSASPNSDVGIGPPLTPASRDSHSGGSSNARQLAYAIPSPQQPATAVLSSPSHSDLPVHERTRSLSANSSLAHATAANVANHASEAASSDSAPPLHSAALHSHPAHASHSHSMHLSSPVTPQRVPAMVLPSTRTHAAASSQVASAAAEPAPPASMRTPLALNLNPARTQRATTVASSPRSLGTVAVAASPSSTSVPAPGVGGGGGGPPPFLRMNSVSLTPTLCSSISLVWVCQTNRELVRTLFAKKAPNAHRGILDSHFVGMQGDSLGGGLTPAHVRRPSSATAPTLQQQLLHAPLSRFHIGVVGSAGSGKTSTLCNITGRSVPPKHQETSGLQLLDVTWPYKTAEGAVSLLDCLFWDSGFTSSTQYKYVSTTPELHAHLMIYVVSAVDKGSWSVVQKKIEEDAQKPWGKMMVLTKSVRTHSHAQRCTASNARWACSRHTHLLLRSHAPLVCCLSSCFCAALQNRRSYPEARSAGIGYTRIPGELQQAALPGRCRCAAALWRRLCLYCHRLRCSSFVHSRFSNRVQDRQLADFDRSILHATGSHIAAQHHRGHVPHTSSADATKQVKSLPLRCCSIVPLVRIASFPSYDVTCLKINLKRDRSIGSPSLATAMLRRPRDRISIISIDRECRRARSCNQCAKVSVLHALLLRVRPAAALSLSGAARVPAAAVAAPPPRPAALAVPIQDGLEAARAARA